MKKNIYGLIDLKTGNFGDLCILDRDEEFRDGCIKLFRDSDVPDYVVRDLMAVCYGTISYDSGLLYPKIDLAFRMIISGADALSLKSDVSLETSDVHSDDDDISPIPAEEVII